MQFVLAQSTPDLGIAHVALLLVFLLIVSVVVFWTAAAITKRLSDPVARLRLLAIGGFSLAGVISYGLFGAIETGTILTNALGSPLTNSPVGGFAAKLLTCLLASSVVLVADLSVFPTVSDVRDLERTARKEALAFSRILLVFSACVAIVLTLLEPALFGDGSPVLALAGVVSLFGLLYAVLPVFAAKLGAGRRPTDDEADRINSLCQTGDLTPSTVRVLDGSSTETLKTHVRRTVRGQYFYVTDYFLDSLDDDAAAALVAAAAGQATLYCLEYKVFGLLSVVAIGTLAITSGGWTGVIAAFGSIAVLVPVFLWGGRRLQFRADAYAADRVGAGAVADAFERVADLHGIEPSRGRFSRFFKPRPPLGRRIDRLRERASS